MFIMFAWNPGTMKSLFYMEDMQMQILDFCLMDLSPVTPAMVQWKLGTFKMNHFGFVWKFWKLVSFSTDKNDGMILFTMLVLGGSSQSVSG